jgi:hypothetical protein
MDVKYQRDTARFDFIGLDLNRPLDSVKQGKLPYAKNIRSYLAGRIEPRDGLTDTGQVVVGQSPVHSCRRLNTINDPTNTMWTRVVGTGTHVAYGQGPYTDLDSGYSGDPLALVPWKPLASPVSFMYIGDRSRMRKVSPTGALHQIGLPAPAAAPPVALTNAPSYKNIDTFDATTGWVAAGAAGAPSLISRTPGGASGSTTTISQILYDSGSTGWACVQLLSMVGVGRGELLNFATNAESAYVQDVFGQSASTTIAAIVYDSGTTGDCAIFLTTPVDEIEVNSLVTNSTVSENIRIKAKLVGPTGQSSYRATTVGTFQAGDTMTAIPSMRIYLVNNHAAAENVSNDAVTSAVTAGTGYLTKTISLDLARIATGVAALPDDYIGLGMLVDNPANLSYVKAQLDVDVSDGGAPFSKNFYYREIRPSDLTPNVQNQQALVTTGATILQRQIIDGVPPTDNSPGPFLPGALPDSATAGYSALSGNAATTNSMPASGTLDITNAPVNATITSRQPSASKLLIDDLTTPAAAPNVQSSQLESGQSQWVDVRFHISDLIRVGTDDSRTLRNVVTIQFVIVCTGTVNVSFDSWWIGGGYGPDNLSTTASSYYYRYRARTLSTNVASNWSPATRLSIDAYRQSVTITPPQYAVPSGTTHVTGDFALDIERFGGENPDWHYVGTIANGATPSFADVYDDITVAGQPVILQNDYQPWPILGVPVSGTTGQVAGTSVKDSGTNFNLSWAPGTRIIINNQPYTIYQVQSTSLLELVQNAGSQTGVVWQINEPTILAQPLPCLWEWDGYWLACGDPVNPGRLYYSNPGAETTNPSNFLDMTSPSEPLMNGLQYNVRSYVFSTENFIQVLQTGDPQNPFRHENIPNGKGMFSRWALTREPSPVIAYLTKDGLYMSMGQSPVSITDADLYDLFPNEGNLGMDINGVSAPQITSGNATGLRLTYYDDYLYFDYPTIGATRSTLVLSFDLGAAVRGEAPGGWLYDIFTPNAQFHYGEEGAGVHSLLIGGVDSHLYRYAGNSDNGAAITMEFTTPSKDQGDPRQNKFYGDLMLDSNTGGVSANITPFFNNNATNGVTTSISTASRNQTIVPILASSGWQTARNISMFMTCQVSTAVRPFFFIWEIRYTFESAPLAALSWNISPSTFGMENYKHFGLCKITHVSTADFTITFTVDGVAQTPITIPNSGGIYKQSIFRVPVMKAKLYQVLINTSDNVTTLRLDPRDTFLEVKNWGVDDAYHELRIFSDYADIQG